MIDPNASLKRVLYDVIVWRSVAMVQIIFNCEILKKSLKIYLGPKSWIIRYLGCGGQKSDEKK